MRRRTEVPLLGIEGYDPLWHHSGDVLAAAHRARFAQLIGRPLDGAWVMWDLDARTRFANGPVILGFGDANVEITHRKFDECAVTWNQIDMSMPADWAGMGRRLDWREETDAAPVGRPLRGVNVIERVMPSAWRPTAMHAIELMFEGARLAVFNALDENGLDTSSDVDLPIGSWRRVSIA